MSSARDSGKKRARHDGASTRTSSIARSIAFSMWGRLFAWFLSLDILLAVVFLGTVVWTGVQDVPGGWGIASIGELLGAMSLRVSDPFDLANLQLVIARPDGNIELSLASHLPFIYTVGGALLVAEVLALVSGFSEARRIRRKLRPLNDLALTAETLASSTGRTDSMTLNQIENLEHAIEHASPDAPHISTGDKDLRSIEVALNSLLQRMREAQAQQARFVSDASHELRTPIAVIEGYVSMLDRWGKSDPAVLDESIAALKNESAHMKELIEQLLFLARGDSGRNTLERTTFCALDLLQELTNESQMIDTGHRYALQTVDSVLSQLTLTADRAMVKQCLRVIVQNAIRYSPPGTDITLGLRYDEPHGLVGFDIEDRGIGMNTRDASHVFERFYRADAARTNSKEGTGLGLAIAKWIAEAHNGRIDVLSLEDVGTRFTVWLPAAYSQVPHTSGS